MSREGLSFLQIENVVKTFSQKRGGLRSFLHLVARTAVTQYVVRAVDGVSISVAKGETVALLGESGSGKTTLGRIVVGLEMADSGRVALMGDEVRYVRRSGQMRGRLQMVFQDPASSLDPYLNVMSCVSEPIERQHLPKSEVRTRVVASLNDVGLDESFLGRRAMDLSGGQRQRVAIARSIISNPDVIVLDEPTSSIDVSIQAQVLNLLADLQRLKNLTYVLITHDPNVARYMADNIAVMRLGKIVEYGQAEQVLDRPQHEYTKVLLASAPRLVLSPPAG